MLKFLTSRFSAEQLKQWLRRPLNWVGALPRGTSAKQGGDKYTARVITCFLFHCPFLTMTTKKKTIDIEIAKNTQSQPVGTEHDVV